MKYIYRFGLVQVSICLLLVSVVVAGNPDRRGQAGASELLINPWARSSGFHSLNTAHVTGIEATRLNVAGLAFTPQTEVNFANTQWLLGTGVSFNTFGVAQKVGEAGVLGLDLMSINFGDIEITTTEQPEGGLGTFSPQFINLALSYAHKFSNSIYGGFVVRGVNQRIPDAISTGVALDAGVQYVTGPHDNIRFGVSLRNIGTPMRFSGDGLAFRGESPDGTHTMTVQQRSANFEMPSLLHIGGAYDFLFMDDHRLTVVANFTSNSFTQDQVGLGAEYAFRNFFMVRGGYRIETGRLQGEVARDWAYTGPAGGFSVELPLKSRPDAPEDDESGEVVEETSIPVLGLDYSFRFTNPFRGTHTVGVRVRL